MKKAPDFSEALEFIVWPSLSGLVEFALIPTVKLEHFLVGSLPLEPFP